MLALYLTLAPYGGNLEGIRAASLAYFGKEPKKLSLAEAALLVALPQSPELRRPDRSATPRARRATACSTASPRPGTIPADEIAFAKLDAVAAGSAADAGAGAACRRSGGRGRCRSRRSIG